MRDVFISGEDDATRAVIRRLVSDYNPKLHIIQSLPAAMYLHGVVNQYPIILLTDLDDDPCAPIGKTNLLNGITQSSGFVINIACDEVEAWLMADTEGFANFFGIPLTEMPKFLPQKMQGRKPLSEISLNVKSSWHFTHQLAHLSTKSDVRAQVSVPLNDKTCKGKEYNTAVVPFIEKVWKPETGRLVSDSLNRMINRIQGL